MEFGQAAGAFGVALAGIELAKFTIGKVATKMNGRHGAAAFPSAQARQVHDLHESLAPRIIELLKEIRDELREMRVSQ